MPDRALAKQLGNDGIGIKRAMDDTRPSTHSDGNSAECPSWFERVMEHDAVTLRSAVIIGCAVFWGIVSLLIFT